MAKTKPYSYISHELDFAEKSLKQWKKYIDDNPIDKAEDRWGMKEMPKGGVAKVVVATREQVIKSIQDTMQKYLQLLEVVDNLREKEALKMTKRGQGELSASERGDLD